MSNHARRPQQLKSDFNSYYTNQAKIFAESNAKMSNSIQELPTTRSPYNPEIFCDVDQRVTQYIKQSERRPVLTKYSYGVFEKIMAFVEHLGHFICTLTLNNMDKIL